MPDPSPKEAATETHHALNAGRFRFGDVFAWRDERSETGWCSGIVVTSSHLHFTVTVRDIRAGRLVQEIGARSPEVEEAGGKAQ